MSEEFMKRQNFLKIIAIAVILISIQLGVSTPALALLREHHQSPGVLRYHAQHSLQDKEQRAWQIILFPEDINSTTTRYSLRLVGFPDLVEVVHPQPLEIITSQGQTFTAPDVFPTATPAINVGQYELTDLIPLLPPKGSLTLVLSTIDSEQKNKDVSLKIVPSILSEWRILTQR